MIRKVAAGRSLRLRDFLKFLEAKQKTKLLKLAGSLKKKRVVHVNATAAGGGVAEILKSFIPYLQSVGIRAEWYAINPQLAGERFFVVTDKMRDALQGEKTTITKSDWALYEKVNRQIAKDLDRIGGDVLVIHDWQLLFSATYLKKQKPQIYISHPDTSSVQKDIWAKMLPALKVYKLVLFSNREHVHYGLAKEKVRVIAPVIDPLALKQRIVAQGKARQYLASYGIPNQGDLVVQVSRFGVWKNPLGVVEAFRLTQKKHPRAQLALVGIEEAVDNPAAEKLYKKVKKAVEKDPNIHLFFDPGGIGGLKHIEKFTMIAQNAADVVVQNSIKEGFGLTVTEAMWKGKAVVGGPASGIKKQIMHGKNGYRAKNSKELAYYMDYLLCYPQERKRLGKKAKESVRKNFLMPRFLLDHLRVYKQSL